VQPDSIETRTGRLEQTVAALKQKVDDIAEDVRVFYPLVAGQEVLREKLDRMSHDLADQTAAVAQVRLAIEAGERDRERVRREREDKDAERDRADKRDRWARLIGAGALVFTAVSSTVAVIALVLQ
jgi:chromosome segregation ATPase